LLFHEFSYYEYKALWETERPNLPYKIMSRKPVAAFKPITFAHNFAEMFLKILAL